MGGELGQEAEWSEERELDWWLLDNPDTAGLNQLVRDINGAYRAEPAMWSLDSDPSGFQWIDANDSRSNVYSFLRRGSDGSTVACISNFSASAYESYRLGLPAPGAWRELVNSDAEHYGGSGVGNLGRVGAGPVEWHGQPASATLRIPPLATVWLRHEPAE
jgi:1,4-alpha-glucan branching enzyme